MILGPPIGLVASLVGLVRDERKGYAIAGTLVGALGCLPVFLPLVSSCL